MTFPTFTNTLRISTVSPENLKTVLTHLYRPAGESLTEKDTTLSLIDVRPPEDNDDYLHPLFRLARWGCEWDVTARITRRTPTSVTMLFDSHGGVPDVALRYLAADFPSVTFKHSWVTPEGLKTVTIHNGEPGITVRSTM